MVCVVAPQPQLLGVTIVTVATMGTNTVVPLSIGVSFLYVTVACGWLVEVAQTQRHNFSLKVTKTFRLLATAAEAKPTGDKYTIAKFSYILATTSTTAACIITTTVAAIAKPVETLVYQVVLTLL